MFLNLSSTADALLQVAAGMKTDLQIELYAMAIGLVNPEGVGYIAHHIQIQTETEIFFLPVTANILYY